MFPSLVRGWNKYSHSLVLTILNLHFCFVMEMLERLEKQIQIVWILLVKYVCISHYKYVVTTYFKIFFVMFESIIIIVLIITNINNKKYNPKHI